MPPTAMQAITEALERVGPMTAAELRQLLDRSQSAVYKPLKRLRDQKVVRISKWVPQETTGGRRSPVYALGRAPDAVEPPAATSNERNRKYNRRNAARLAAKRRLRAGTADVNPWRGLVR